MTRLLLVALVALAARPAVALPPDLAAVPPSAVGFAHVRLADTLKHPSMADYRELLNKAGARALAAFDDQFVPRPSSLDRVTVVGLLGKSPDESVAVILHFAEPFELKTVAASALPGAVPLKGATTPTYFDERSQVTLAAPDPSTLVIGSAVVVKLVTAGRPAGRHPLADALAAADEPGLALFAAVNIAAMQIPPEAIEQMPENLRPLAAAQTLTTRVKLTDTADVRVKLTYADEPAAVAADKAMRDGAEMLRKLIALQRQQPETMLFKNAPPKGQYRKLDEMPDMLGAVATIAVMTYADSVLANLPVKRDGTALTAEVSLPPYMTAYVGMSAMSVGLALPAVQKTRAAAARMQSQNNLKQIALAMHNYHDTNGTFPPAAVVDKKGKPLLSWRVMILPYIEQQALYSKFKLDEPWDSEHNKPFSDLAVKVYMDPRDPSIQPGMTTYKVFVGKDAGFSLLKGRKIAAIPDGSSNTILAVSAGEPVPWAKPDDIPFDTDKPMPDLRTPGFPDIIAAMMDGSVRVLDPKGFANEKNRELMKRLVNPADGMVNPDF